MVNESDSDMIGLKNLIAEVSKTFKDIDQTEKEFREGFRFDDD